MNTLVYKKKINQTFEPEIDKTTWQKFVNEIYATLDSASVDVAVPDTPFQKLTYDHEGKLVFGHDHLLTMGTGT